MKKILVATQKPFAKEAVEQIKEICKKNSYELILLEKYEKKEELVEKIKEVDALIVRSDKITKEILDEAKNLKIIVRGGAGYDNIDFVSAKEKNIVVMNTPGQNSNAVAELAFGMMVFMARNKFQPKAGSELKGKKIGIHAFGNVGQNVARIAKGFGMEVFAFDPFLDAKEIEKHGVKPLLSAEKLYETCQYISLHIPANEKTKNSINSEILSKMPKNAVLVNTARKEVIDEDSLLDLMSKREDFCYISDIAPVKKEEFLEKFADRCFFTPKKMGAQTLEANINAGVAATNQIIAFFEKNDTTFQVNK